MAQEDPSLTIAALGAAVNHWKEKCRVAEEKATDVVWVIRLQMDIRVFSNFDAAVRTLRDYAKYRIKTCPRIEELISDWQRVNEELDILDGTKDWFSDDNHPYLIRKCRVDISLQKMNLCHASLGIEDISKLKLSS